MFFTTDQGYERLKNDLESAENFYKRICDSNSEVASSGDNSVWHDNFGYEQNQRDMYMWAKRISDLKKILSEVKVVTIPEKPNKVQIGCIVTFYDSIEDRKWTFEVAGYNDSDIGKGRIAYNTPFMQKFMDKKKEEEQEIFFDEKNRLLTIIKIETKQKK